MEDIVDLLKREGYGVVEGMDAVLAKIEEMAGDKEEYGKRTPGERCMYEIQRSISRTSVRTD